MEEMIQFPDPNLAENDGLVAVGGSLSRDYLISAYSQGLFPWFNEGEPILWWSPNPRMVLYPHRFKISSSLKQRLHSKKYFVKADTNFNRVIENCAMVSRKGQRGTWITSDMVEAYTELHIHGYAHSIETYEGDQLVGGLYGISLGRAFFGESMFYYKTDASKFALYHLSSLMQQWEYHFIDVQQSTVHLRSLGAEDLDRRRFLEELKEALKYPTKQERWKID
ncbi:MAG: leucyl/phenylalanyl-tRNA--protein transferase [Bacteroidales bacterium]|nr:leucyl/phenylalanyl-tRNA--protein transferase [Bacteroidales bacterium]